MQQWPHHQNLRHSAGFHGFHAHSPWVVNGWNASNAVRKWRTWRSRAGCSARFWPRRDWIGWCICRICEWGRRRGVRIRRRRWWRTIEWAAMCSIWRSRGREAGWAWRRWTRRLWFLIFACSLECLFEKQRDESWQSVCDYETGKGSMECDMIVSEGMKWMECLEWLDWLIDYKNKRNHWKRELKYCTYFLLTFVAKETIRTKW